MQAEVIIVNGKRRVILRNHASEIDKTKEVALIIMGPNFKYKDTTK